MTSIEAYHKFLIKVNKNDSNSNINVPIGKFVSIYNEEAEEIAGEMTDDLEASDSQNDIQELLLPDVKLVKVESQKEFVLFRLPENFLKFENSYSLAVRKNCERVLENWDVKSKDERLFLKDKNNNPSFDYEETLLKISDNKIKIYRTDFDIKEAYFTYYKIPKKIDIEGYINVDNTRSTTINPDISNYLVNKILDRCALEVAANVQNTESFQISQVKEKLEK